VEKKKPTKIIVEEGIKEQGDRLKGVKENGMFLQE
jgi:hypothetical protein